MLFEIFIAFHHDLSVAQPGRWIIRMRRNLVVAIAGVAIIAAAIGGYWAGLRSDIEKVSFR
jgi:hypothetical protein